MSEVLFIDGAVLPLDKNDEVIVDGWLLVKDGVVDSYGEMAQGVPEVSAGAQKVDLQGKLLMPGLVNAHTHAAMTIFRGIADDLPLMQWLQEYIFPAETHLTAEWVKAGTELACVEMIRSGTTTAVDMYLFEDYAMQAFDKSGMRALCAEAVYDFPSPNYGTPDKGLEYVRGLMDKWLSHPLVKPAVVAHSPYTCAPHLLQDLNKIAEEFSVPYHIHIAETQHEVGIIEENYKCRPVQHLDALGLLGPQLLGAHGVWVTDEEVLLCAQKGVNIIHCPQSNMKLASGFAPVPEYLKHGINVGLGTDGAASNNSLDMFREMTFAAKIHKGITGDPTVCNDREVLRMATINGAKAAGLDGVTGSLAPGKSADLIVLDFTATHLTPVYDYISHVVYSATGSDVLHSMVNGKWLMKDREVLTLDEEKISSTVMGMAAEVRAAMNQKD